MPSLEVPVLIVGGGPVGLTTAIGLRNHGVDCLLVERHPSTLDFPKGRRVTVRSVEIFRQWGLEDSVVAVSLPRTERSVNIATMPTTTNATARIRPGQRGPWIARVVATYAIVAHRAS